MVPRVLSQRSSWGLAPALVPPAAAPVAVLLPPPRVGVVALHPPMAMKDETAMAAMALRGENLAVAVPGMSVSPMRTSWGVKSSRFDFTAVHYSVATFIVNRSVNRNFRKGSRTRRDPCLQAISYSCKRGSCRSLRNLVAVQGQEPGMPFSSRYQLLQPVVQTVFFMLASISALKRSVASSRGETVSNLRCAQRSTNFMI